MRSFGLRNGSRCSQFLNRVRSALTVLTAILLRDSAPARPSQTAAVFDIPFPAGGADSLNLALSPDGKSLALTAVENGNGNLHVRRFDA